MNKLLISLPLLAYAALVQADNRQGFYLGAGISRLETNYTTVTGSTTAVNTAEFQVGYKLNPYVGGELRVGTGISDSDGSGDVAGNTENFDLTIPRYESLYYRFESTNQVAKSYLLIGASNVSMDFDYESALIGSGSTSEAGLSYGVGVGFVVGERGNINFEYRSLLNTDEFEINAYSITYDFRF